MRLFNLWCFLLAGLLYALLKLLFDNILYAGIVLWLHSSFGIEERDVATIVAANLIPILVTIGALAGIYRLALRHHEAKAAALSHAPSPQEATTADGKKRPVISRLRQLEPLPAITLGLAVAVIGVAYYQNWTNRQPAPPPLSDQEKKDRLGLLNRQMVQLNNMRNAVAVAKEVSDNWQYLAQNDPSTFLINVTSAANGFYAGQTELKGLESVLSANQKDMAYLFKTDFPQCSEKTNALHGEIYRINSHRGAELVFTLLNDIKLIEFRAVVPDCERWTNSKIDATSKKQAEYR